MPIEMERKGAIADPSDYVITRRRHSSYGAAVLPFCRTHEGNAPVPVFKSRESHICATQTHVIAKNGATGNSNSVVRSFPGEWGLIATLSAT
jgi:hypothetical protein